MATVVLSAASPERPALQALDTVLDGELRRFGETDVRRFCLAATPLGWRYQVHKNGLAQAALRARPLD
jgi:hypothetical protein